MQSLDYLIYKLCVENSSTTQNILETPMYLISKREELHLH